MRIISKFYDYYDCIQRYGIDKSVIYKRITKSLDENLPKEVKQKIKKIRKYAWAIDSFRQSERVSLFVIIVVSKCYIGVEHQENYFFSRDSFELYSKNKKLSFHDSDYKGIFRLISNFEISLDFAICYKSPLFFHGLFTEQSSHEFKTIKDPCLKTYDFFKIMHPTEIFQEIQRFMSGVLPLPNKSILPVSDKLKIQSHGFDEWSFRKKGK